MKKAYAGWLGYGAVIVMTILTSLRKIDDPDGFWMLAGGRLILDSGMPAVNTFSHTFPDHPWKFTQWLPAVLYEFMRSIAGFEGIQILLISIALAIFLTLTYRASLEKEDFNWWVLIFFAIMALASTRMRITPRGDIFTVLGLSVTFLIWKLKPGKVHIYAAVSSLVWTNCHSGVIFGVILWGIITVAALISGDREDFKKARLSALFFFIATFINPNFHYHYLYLLENAQPFPLPIAELQPPSLYNNTILWCYAALSLPALYRAFRKKDYLLIGAYLFFFALSFTGIRFISYLFITTVPGVVNHTSWYFREPLNRKKLLPLTAAIILFAPLLAGAAIYWEYGRHVTMYWGLGLNRLYYPEGAADVILTRKLKGRIFNEFDHGGYLAWRLYPQQRVFIDGRGSTYPLQFFEDSKKYGLQTLKKLLDDNAIDIAVIQRRALINQVDLGPLLDQYGWNLINIEGIAYLFVRPGSVADDQMTGRRFELIRPWLPKKDIVELCQANRERARLELSWIDPSKLIQANDFHTFGVAAFAIGMMNESARLLYEAVERDPKNIVFLIDYSSALQATGNFDLYRNVLNKIITLAPGTWMAGDAQRKLEQLGRLR